MKPSRHPRIEGYGQYSLYTHDCIDRFLRHHQIAAKRAILKLQQLPKDHRPDWVQNMLRHWRSVYRGFKWARGHNRRTALGRYPHVRPGPETVDRTFSGGISPDNSTDV